MNGKAFLMRLHPRLVGGDRRVVSVDARAMTKQECGTCRFFLASANWCRRYPPTVIATTFTANDQQHIEWWQNSPTVTAGDWCGEWHR